MSVAGRISQTMSMLRIFAIVTGLASALVSFLLIAQYRSVSPLIPLVAGASLLAITGMWRPASRRRRQALLWAWLAYTGATIATIVLMVLMAATQGTLAVLFG